MTTLNLHDHFVAIWRRALNEPALDNLTPALVESWATARGLSVECVEESEVGLFGKTKSIVLTVRGGRACFPRILPEGDATWERQRHVADHNANLWEKLEWFAPLWVPRVDLQQLLIETANCSRERAIELFNYHTSTIYTLAFQAVCIAQIMPQAHSLREFCPLAREAYLAFYSGYRAASIAALIPVIEGSLTRIVSSAGAGLSTYDKIDRAVNRAIDLSARLHFEGMVPRRASSPIRRFVVTLTTGLVSAAALAVFENQIKGQWAPWARILTVCVLGVIALYFLVWALVTGVSWLRLRRAAHRTEPETRGPLLACAAMFTQAMSQSFAKSSGNVLNALNEAKALDPRATVAYLAHLGTLGTGAQYLSSPISELKGFRRWRGYTGCQTCKETMFACVVRLPQPWQRLRVRTPIELGMRSEITLTSLAIASRN
jgi:hypothetical protein